MTADREEERTQASLAFRDRREGKEPVTGGEGRRATEKTQEKRRTHSKMEGKLIIFASFKK